ncbi:OmpA family protein [Pendulispora brunnea]|uniref:OmpA family protein n=1 Tax=Pendulispora brunnea TaxID=2905690 RepID=A0ABZ2KGY3_9BACT
MKSKYVFALAPLACFLAACASTTTPNELVRARTAYNGVSQGMARELAPADVRVARQTLDVAERSFDDDGDSDETKDLAYAAQRRAECADAKARTQFALQQERDAVMREKIVHEQVDKANKAKLEAALEKERQDKQAADRRMAELNQIASVRKDDRGTIITVPGSSLFPAGKSTLLPAARAKLTQLATVLAEQDPSIKIQIEGYTDSAGSVKTNDRLSQARAETVRGFLASSGVPTGRLTATGMGSANPVGSNATAEGRASNRRVEIVVQDAKAPSKEIR